MDELDMFHLDAVWNERGLESDDAWVFGVVHESFMVLERFPNFLNVRITNKPAVYDPPMKRKIIVLSSSAVP